MLLLEQVVSRPQAREASSQDSHVGLVRTLQRRPRGEIFARRLQPEAVRTVVLALRASVLLCTNGAGQPLPPTLSIVGLQRQALVSCAGAQTGEPHSYYRHVGTLRYLRLSSGSRARARARSKRRRSPPRSSPGPPCRRRAPGRTG